MAASCLARRGSVARMWEMAHRLVDHTEQAGACVIVGHSAGATLAILAARLSPVVRAVILIEPMPSQFFTRYDNHSRMPGLTLAAIAQPNEMATYPLASQDTIRSIESHLERAGHRIKADRPVPASDTRRAVVVEREFARLSLPVLILRGERSGLLRAEDAAMLQSAGHEVRVTQVSEAGHSPHVDRPRLTSEALLAFEQEHAVSWTSTL